MLVGPAASRGPEKRSQYLTELTENPFFRDARYVTYNTTTDRSLLDSIDLERVGVWIRVGVEALSCDGVG